MTLRSRSLARTRHAPCTATASPATLGMLPEAERLVALGFRYWMLGRVTGDIVCWERAWTLYSGMLGVVGARPAIDTLACFARAIGCASRRPIEVGAVACSAVCRDECIAVSMIAACQHQTCPAMRACAFALIESAAIEPVVSSAQAFAETMAGVEQVLSPASIIAVPLSQVPANRLPA